LSYRIEVKRPAAKALEKIPKAGSHTQFRHPERKGRVTVPHPKKEIPIGTLKSIERQSGIKFS